MTSAQKKYTMMNRKDVRRLLDLIESSPILLSKEMNAPTNKLKEEAWVAITNSFNDHSISPRNTVQLKLKWDNLKKAARKRAHLIKTKPVGPKIHYIIAPDVTLDRVISILDSGAYFEYSIEIDRDDSVGLEEDPEPSEPDENLDHSSNDASANISKYIFLPPTSGAQNREVEFYDPGNKSTSEMDNSLNNKAQIEKPEIDNFDNEDTSGVANSLKRNDKIKKKKSACRRTKLNMALTKYYELKSQKLELEIEMLKKSLNEHRN